MVAGGSDTEGETGPETKKEAAGKISRRPLESLILLELSLQEGPPRAAGSFMWRWKYLTVAGTAAQRPVREPRRAMAATNAHAEAVRASVLCVRSEMLIG
jgi:hypothetical protein